MVWGLLDEDGLPGYVRNVGVLLIRLGFWRRLHCNYSKEPSKIV